MASSLLFDEQHSDVEKSFENYKKILSSVPTEKGGIFKHVYLYQGYWHSYNHALGIMATKQYFKARPTDVFLISTPKAGTIWFKAILFAVMNRSQYQISNHPLLITNAHNCVPNLEMQLFKEPPFIDVENIPSPRLFGTHIPFLSLPDSITRSGSKMIYICRNPKDVLVSYWHFISNIRQKDLPPLSLDEAFEMFCAGKIEYGPFWDHVKEYKKASLENPDKLLFITYEEMKRDVVACTKRLAEFLRCPFSLKDEKEGVIDDIINLCSFGNMSKLEVNKTLKAFVGEDVRLNILRQGRVGDWKNHLSAEMIKCLDRITDEKLEGIFSPVIEDPKR